MTLADDVRDGTQMTRKEVVELLDRRIVELQEARAELKALRSRLEELLEKHRFDDRGLGSEIREVLEGKGA